MRTRTRTVDPDYNPWADDSGDSGDAIDSGDLDDPD